MTEDPNVIVAMQPPFTKADIHVVRDADWIDAIPQLLDGGEPMDLTGMELELWIMPRHDHSVLFKKLRSVGANAEITFEDAQQGLAQIYVERDAVRQQLPIGQWEYFLLLIDGSVISEVCRGDFYVHAGNVAAI